MIIKQELVLQDLVHNLTRSGENILILSGSKTIHSQSQRVNGFLDTMKQYPEILLSNVIYTEDKLEISNKLLKEILSKKYYKTIVMVDSWLANAGEVVAQTGYNDINILGFDLMPQNKEALKQGKLLISLTKVLICKAMNVYIKYANI